MTTTPAYPVAALIACDHGPELAQLRAQVTALRAENASLTRDLLRAQRHLLLVEDSPLELQRLAENHEAREHTPKAGAPVWLPEREDD